MGKIVKFPRHKLAVHGWAAEHGLLLCETCGGAEGMMPTDCPQRMLTEDEGASIMSGIRDYRNGKWVRRTGRSR